MPKNYLQVALMSTLMLAGASTCQAGGWGKALREAIESLGKRSGKVVREGVEEGVERSAARLTRPLVREGVEKAASKSAGRFGRKAALEAGEDAGAVALRLGEKVTKPVVAKFGDDGARALGSLSKEGAERLAKMTDDLAAGGRGGDWMQLIAERGDEVTDWLWQRRGSVIVGTVATAIVLQPEDFLQASERVATATVNAAGEHVLEPLISNGAEHIAAPIAEHAAAGFPWESAWMLAILSAVGWLVYRRRRSAVGA